MNKTIINAVNQMNSDDINELITVIKRRRQILSSMAANSFTRGDKVTFENNGRTEPGVVFKVKRKYIEVDVSYFNRIYGKSKFSDFKIFGAFFETINLIYRLKKTKL